VAAATAIPAIAPPAIPAIKAGSNPQSCVDTQAVALLFAFGSQIYCVQLSCCLSSPE